MWKVLEKSVAYALCYVVRYYGKTNKFTNLTAFSVPWGSFNNYVRGQEEGGGGQLTKGR